MKTLFFKNRNFLFVPLIAILMVCLPSLATAKCVSFSANGINNWYPFVYRTEKGDLTGTIVDGAQEALSRMGVDLVSQNDKPWKRILYDLQEGSVDVVMGAYWNSERAGKYEYSEPLGTDDVRVFVKSGTEFPLSSLKDLIGRNGFKLLGGSYGDQFDKFSNEYLDTTDIRRSDEIIKMMAAGRGDYGIVGYIEGLQHIKAQGLEGQVVALSWPVLSTDVHMLINRKAACAGRVDELNATIRILKKEGVLQQLLQKHLASNQS